MMIGSDIDVNRVFKVRPFEVTIGPSNTMTLVLKGEIRGDGYVLTLVDLEYTLRTTLVDWDERGPFAMVRDADTTDNTWLLRIQAEYDEPIGDRVLPPGCWIHFHKPGDQPWYEEIAEQAGYDLNKVHVLVPVDQPGYSIHFDSDGEYECASFPDAVHSRDSGLDTA